MKLSMHLLERASMNNKLLFVLTTLFILVGTATCKERVENLTLAVEKGDLSQIDSLIAKNDYTYGEYDLVIAETDRIMFESKSWWFVIWLMMILGALVAFKACLEALKLARKAPKYNNMSSIFSGIFILALGGAGVYIGHKGINKYTLYTKAPEIALRLQAAKKNALASHTAPIKVT